GGLVGLAAFLGSQRLDGIVRALVGKGLIGICLVIVLVLTGLGGLVLNRPKPIAADPAFDGTPLAVPQVTGRLGGVNDTARTAVEDFAVDNEGVYDQMLATLRQQWDRRPIKGNWTNRGMVPPAGAAGEEDADDSDRAVSTFVFGSDLHCNIGMARVVGEVAG